MEPKQETLPPVAIGQHYEIFKTAEDDIKGYLSELDYDPLLVGLRVSYGLIPEKAPEHDALPYKIDFGYVEAIDCALDQPEEDLTAEAWEEAARGRFARNPMPAHFLSQIYEKTKAALENAADAPLYIGITIVLYGSPLQGYYVGCLCTKNGKRKQKYCYYDKKLKKTKCYCTNINC